MKLDSNYSVNTDGAGTILLFEEQRKREKDGVELEFTFKDQWFYLNIQQALTSTWILRSRMLRTLRSVLIR